MVSHPESDFVDPSVSRGAGRQVGATGVLVDNYIKVVWTETSPPGTYFIVANDRGAQRVIGRFEIPPGGYKGRIFVCVDAQGSFIVAGETNAMNAEGSIGVFTRPSRTEDIGYDPATTSMLGAAGATVSSVSGPRQMGAIFAASSAF